MPSLVGAWASGGSGVGRGSPLAQASSAPSWPGDGAPRWTFRLRAVQVGGQRRGASARRVRAAGRWLRWSGLRSAAGR
eukprot:5344740-Alexandrium_andersonii.AAC.1